MGIRWGYLDCLGYEVRKGFEEAERMAKIESESWGEEAGHLTLRRGRKIAKVAMARKLAVRLYWMMRKEWDYERLRKFGSHAGKPGTGDGVK